MGIAQSDVHPSLNMVQPSPPMHRPSILLLALLLPLIGSAQPVTFAPLPLAAGPGATAPTLASAMDGSLYVSWVEPFADTAGSGHALRLAQFDREADAWSAPRTIATGADWSINDADTPTIAAGLRGRLAAVWYVRHGGAAPGAHAVYATSEDRGATWSPPQPLSVESNANEFVKVVALLSGKWLALWLDGRAAPDGGATQLRSRVLGSDEPDVLVDDRVCDCCSIAAMLLPNGALLATYRDRSADEVRDFAFIRYSRGAWTPATGPATDGWLINGCPVNGASLARRGAHVAAAWFTAAHDQPTVMTARSNDIGATWNLVTAVSEATPRPTGHVGSAVTRDGHQWISWTEADGALALRGVKAEGGLGPINRLPLAPGTRVGPHAVPHLTLLDNKSDQPARLLIARPESTGIATYTASLPLEEGAAIDDCGCGGGTEADRGHALRGRIVDVMTARQALLIAHEEIPGVMKAMTMMFQVDPRVLPLVQPGQEILARMERRDDGKWWVFNLRLLKQVP